MARKHGHEYGSEETTEEPGEGSEQPTPVPAPKTVRIENTLEGDITLAVPGKEVVVPGGKFSQETNKFVNGFVEVKSELLAAVIKNPAAMVYFDLGYLVEV